MTIAVSKWDSRPPGHPSFVPIEGAAATGPQKMFLDLRTVRAALQR